jgi:hypothetical protein
LSLGKNHRRNFFLKPQFHNHSRNVSRIKMNCYWIRFLPSDFIWVVCMKQNLVLANHSILWGNRIFLYYLSWFYVSQVVLSIQIVIFIWYRSMLIFLYMYICLWIFFWHTSLFESSFYSIFKCNSFEYYIFVQHYAYTIMESIHSCMFCKSLFVLLYFFFWPLWWLFIFYLRILITPLVSSNSSHLFHYLNLNLRHLCKF